MNKQYVLVDTAHCGKLLAIYICKSITNKEKHTIDFVLSRETYVRSVVSEDRIEFITQKSHPEYFL